MTNDQKRKLAIGAALEGKAAVAGGIGARVEVSEMELIALVTFAEIGLMSMFSATGGETGAAAKKDLRQTLDAVRETFSSNNRDGLTVLSALTTALLRSEKFASYLPR